MFVLPLDFYLFPCRHQCKFQMLIPRDGLLDDLCLCVRCLAVVIEVHTVISLLEVFIDFQGQVNRLVH